MRLSISLFFLSLLLAACDSGDDPLGEGQFEIETSGVVNAEASGSTSFCYQAGEGPTVFRIGMQVREADNVINYLELGAYSLGGPERIGVGSHAISGIAWQPGWRGHIVVEPLDNPEYSLGFDRGQVTLDRISNSGIEGSFETEASSRDNGSATVSGRFYAVSDSSSECL